LRREERTGNRSSPPISRLSVLAAKEGVGEAELLREGLDDLLKKYSS